jgi:predicted glycosyltransferase
MAKNNKILIDILTPKHVLFFNSLSQRLIKRGFEVFFTTRRYSEVEGMMDLLKVDAQVLGRHGGADLFKKLLAYSERVRLLAEIAKRERPALMLSGGSPEAARVAFGLKIPHFMVNDSPHASAVGRLTAPLSDKIFTPWIIPVGDWLALGAPKGSVERYRGLDPVIWLKDFKPKEAVLSELNLDANKPIISYRPEEFQAAYLGSREPKTSPLIKKILSKLKARLKMDFQIVIMARYGSRKPYYEYFRREAIYADKCVDARSLIYFSSAFISGGGTMLAESALLGTPAISIYPGSTRVEEYLLKKGLAWKHKSQYLTERILSSFLTMPPSARAAMRSKARQILENMEDPGDKILASIEDFLS